MDDDHDLVADIDSDTLIRIVKEAEKWKNSKIWKPKKQLFCN